jgi:hypothetical protein
VNRDLDFFLFSEIRDQPWEKCMPCVVARIYIVLLVVLERGVRVRRNCNIFNLAMENVLKRCGAVQNRVLQGMIVSCLQ